MKIAAVGDIHIGLKIPPALEDALASIHSCADVLLIAGDFTNHGAQREISLCVDLLAGIRLPVIAVLGNHDYESGLEREMSDSLLGIGVHLLDGTACEIEDVGFAGAKGFCGGFMPYELMPFGERSIKNLVELSRHEAAKLEDALAGLTTLSRVAITHYAPIRATIEGEPEPIHPFLGSTHLEHALDRTLPDLAVHGHAHHGSFEGRTAGGVRVCNVAWPVLHRRGEAVPFAIFDSADFAPRSPAQQQRVMPGRREQEPAPG